VNAPVNINKGQQYTRVQMTYSEQCVRDSHVGGSYETSEPWLSFAKADASQKSNSVFNNGGSWAVVYLRQPQ
jgi:hypothetical protein